MHHYFRLFDGASAAMIIAVFSGWLPNVTVVVALVWYSIEIIDSDTVQKRLRVYRLRRIRRRRQKLERQRFLGVPACQSDE